MPKILKPQSGPQERFLATSAEICIFGGSAGGGKTYGLLLSPLRYKNVPGFNCTIFRKNYNQIFAQGGLYDESRKVYSGIKGAELRKGDASWTFSDKDGNQVSKISFAHIERKEEVDKWQGSQICEICCDVSTPVLMADGTYKTVRELKIGDVVQTLNGAFPITALGKERKEECVEVELANGMKQIQTIDHKVLSKNGWISYKDVIRQEMDSIYSFLESKIYCFLQEYGGQSEQRYQEFCRHLQGLYRHVQQVRLAVKEERENRYILYLFGHICCDFLQLLIDEPIGCYFFSKHGQCFEGSIRELLRLRDIQSLDFWRVLEAFSKSLGCQGLWETCVYTVQQDQGNYFGWFPLKRQELLLRILSRLWQELHEQYRSLVQGNGCCEQAYGEDACVLSGRQSGDYQDYYSLCRSLCDEHIRMVRDIYRYDVRHIDGVVIHSPNGSHTGEKGRTHKDSYPFLQYSHPYMESELLVAEEQTHFETLIATPCGEKIVRNFTVSTMNHYITFGGFVNKNCFDEVTHFEKETFFYMLSRNRSMCGVKPYVRATCNPDANSWVADFIAWWIDQETGYAIPERSGVIRWFIRRGEEIYWADSKKELIEQFNLQTVEELAEPKSMTFIASSIYDNKELLRINPQYLANLKALSTVERERLLYGNWKIKPAAGLFFKREQVGNYLNVIPDDVERWVRCWDLAATEKTDSRGEPACTAGVLIGKRKNGRYVIADVINKQMSAADVRHTIRLTAQQDMARYKRVRIRIPQDPGQAGKEQAQSYIKELAGFDITAVIETGSKVTRATPFSAQWQAGNVDIYIADWNESYLLQLENFPEGQLKDMVDASANGFAELELGEQFSLRGFL